MAWSEVLKVPFVKTPYQFNLHGLCDLQIGSESTSLSVIKSRIHEIINDPVDSAVIIPGDIEDEDRPSTRTIRESAFAGRGEVVTRDAQKHMAFVDKEIIPLLLPLQKTKYGIIGVLAGHHWTQLSPVLNSAQYICQELTRLSGKKVSYLGEMSTFLDIRFQSHGRGVRMVGHIQHGEGGGQTKASSVNKLERAFQSFDADFYIRAHDCQIIASKADRLYPKASRDGEHPEMLHKTVAYLNLGAATRGYEMSRGPASYIEKGMMRPSTLGWGTIAFKIRNAYQHEDSHRNYRCDMKITI